LEKVSVFNSFVDYFSLLRPMLFYLAVCHGDSWHTTRRKLFRRTQAAQQELHWQR